MKRVLLALALASMVSLGAVSGSFANYSSEIKSTGNDLIAAKYYLSGQHLDGSFIAKNLATSAAPVIYPGSTGSYYFTVNNGNGNGDYSQVPIDYTIKLNSNGDIRNVDFRLYKVNADGTFTLENSVLDNTNSVTDLHSDILAKTGTSQVDQYKLDWVWDNSTALDATAQDLNDRTHTETFSITVDGTAEVGTSYAHIVGTYKTNNVTSPVDGYEVITKGNNGNQIRIHQGDYQLILNKVSGTDSWQAQVTQDNNTYYVINTSNGGSTVVNEANGYFYVKGYAGSLVSVDLSGYFSGLLQ